MNKAHVIRLVASASSVDRRTLSNRWQPEGDAGNLFERVHEDLAGDA